MGGIKDNWKLMPCGLTELQGGFETQRHSYRALDPEKKMPPINIVFRREDYTTDSEFRESMECKAIELNQAGYNIYQNSQVINDDFEGNVVRDKDIFCYDNLFIDLDRAGSCKEPATEIELLQIEIVKNNIIDFLDKQGWPKPIKVMSGNGYHLYYKLDGWVMTPNKDNQ